MEYKTRINGCQLGYKVGIVLFFAGWGIFIAINLLDNFGWAHFNISQAILGVIILFIPIAILITVVSELLEETVTLYLTEEGIQVRYWLLFKTKQYRWEEFQGYIQSVKPIKTWWIRLLVKSKGNDTLFFYFAQEDFLAFDRTQIKDYEQLIQQLQYYPILNKGFQKAL